MRVVLFYLCSAIVALAQIPFPEPFDTLFGNVLSSSGGVVDDSGIEIVIFADGIEAGSAPLVRDLVRNENYRIEVPTFAAMPDLRVYTVMLREDGQLTELDPTFSFMPMGGALTRRDFTMISEDTDGDMLPDDWERAQTGGNLSLTKDGDPDFDGLTNFEEFLIGTLPNVFSSQVNFKVIRELPNGDIEIAFDVVANRVYHVEASPSASGWTRIRSLVAAQTERVTLAVPPLGFYRIAVTQIDPLDADADTLADDWERSFRGDISLTFEGDPDGDGLTNSQEFLIGTSPIDFGSQINFKVMSETQVAFDAVAGQEYSVQSSSDLVTWTTEETLVATTSERVMLPASTNPFHRLMVK